MEMIVVVVAAVSLYIGMKIGAALVRKSVGSEGVDRILARAKFPVGVAEKIEGQYYLYEKDTTNFLCQAPTLDGLAAALLEKNNISLAILMCPEETAGKVFWCINGKLRIAEV